MKTLEDILKDYKFIARSKQVFRRNPKRFEDGLTNFCTKDGANSYEKLISLLSDLGDLTGISIGKMIDELDDIVREEY